MAVSIDKMGKALGSYGPGMDWYEIVFVHNFGVEYMAFIIFKFLHHIF